nr:hypothetical protein [Tanacetum cinerariifolium]
MAAPLITISSDASEESVTSVVSRVILFGTILTKIPIILDMPTDLPTVPELLAVHLSYAQIDTASPACISTLVIIASLAVRSGIQMTTRKSTLGLCVGPLTPADLYLLN